VTTPRVCRRVGGIVALAVGLVFALTGCMKFDVDLTLDGDTVSGTMVIALSKQLADTAGSELTDQLDTEAPQGSGITSAPYDDGTYVGRAYTLDRAALSAFSDAGDDQDALRIVHDANAHRYTVSGVFDLTEVDLSNPLVSAFANSFQVRIAITFPGKVIEQNGTLDDRTVTWVPVPGQRTELHAVAEDSTSNPAWVWPVVIAAIVVVCAAAAVGIWFLLRRRRPGPPSEPPTESTWESTDTISGV
jgi:hypothetical protein